MIFFTNIIPIGIVLLQADGVTWHNGGLLAPIILRKHLQLAADQRLYVLDREYNLSSLLRALQEQVKLLDGIEGAQT